ncbi:Uu.00g074520.m01.CDS01 [Anthostomella pinea]|uniref:Uu.00g074520.m01.CDS01 n=1 Tax=Anthostomella pinea TaxID=933095 RepID=A0AAI8VVG8_9PEZI|nr:Uu.00g074520.m01.CDS01 [Anthostomella pinea]
MASKTTFIPRFLLPQYGPLWRTTARSTTFARPLNAELGQVLVRYASKTAASKPVATKAATVKKTAATKLTAPKAASTKATSSKASASSTSSKSAAAKAAKASAPTKPPTKTLSAKSTAKATAATRATASKAASSQAATPKPIAGQEPEAEAIVTEPEVQAAAAPKNEAPAITTPAAAAPPKAAAVDPSKPIVLEKPERFNPPSHGARLPRSTPKHYGGPMTTDEVKAQSAKSYPGLPPAENTWTHWFINSRGVHLFITLGTLSSLALYTFAANFRKKSPFADMIPPISEFPSHPFQYIGVCIDVMRMTEEHESAITAEKRRKRVEDVAKRNEYRKAHGMEPASGLSFWGSKAEEKPAEAVAVPVDAAPMVESSELGASPAAEFGADGKRKKFLGIF